MAEYWIDIQDRLNRVANEYGNEKRYEKIVPVILHDLKANEDKKCFFDFSHINDIYDVDLVDAIVKLLKEYGLKGNNIHAVFASEEDKEAFRVLFPEKIEGHIILM